MYNRYEKHRVMFKFALLHRCLMWDLTGSKLEVIFMMRSNWKFLS